MRDGVSDDEASEAGEAGRSGVLCCSCSRRKGVCMCVGWGGLQ